MRLPKTIAGIPIILLVLLPCLYCMYFLVAQYMIQMEMREKLGREQLQTVIVPVNEFKWYEEGREIVVDGMMFDVQSMYRKGDNYIISGLFDEAETKLHIAMGKLQQADNNGPDAQLISLVLSQTMIPPPAENATLWTVAREQSSHNILPDEKLYNTILSIHTPPPRSSS